MTISYAGNFFNLLFRWRGSLWKAVYKELALFLLLYFAVSLFYRIGLRDDEEKRRRFEMVSITFNEYLNYIPITFLLGFYITTIITRWWNQFELIVWPEELMSTVNFVLPGNEEDNVMKRHQIARYFCLTCALAWRDVSVRVRKRFPTLKSVVQAGLMTEHELELYNSIEAVTIRWNLPLQWTQKIIRRGMEEGKIAPALCGVILGQLNKTRDCFRKLYCYDWVCVPLVYTQVTAIATYGFMTFCIVGRQFLDVTKEYEGYNVDFYVPFFTILQFIFYVGWFKVGQELFRPFGTDDDDIELNYILDRHVRSSFAIVHQAIDQEPPLVKDKFWDEPVATLSHSKLSIKIQEHHPPQHAYVRLKHVDDDEMVESQVHPVSKQSDLETKLLEFAGRRKESRSF